MPEQEVRPITEKQFRNLPVIERRGGGGTFLSRVGASIKLTSEGKVSFLQSVFGRENVFTDQSGAILLRDPDDPSRLRPFDEESLSIKDVTADIAGPVLEIAPTLAAGSNPLTVAGAGAVGNVARQTISGMLPGSDELSVEERVLQAGTTAAIAGSSQALVNLGARVFDALRPGNFAARAAQKATQSPMARRGQRLTQETGIPLSFGEETGSRTALMAEGLARRNIVTADEFLRFGQKQLRTALGTLQRRLDRVSSEGLSDLRVGQVLVRSLDDTLNQARSLRRAQASIDFGEVDRLSGGRGVVAPNNLIKEVENIIAEFDVPGAGDAAQQLVNQFKRIKSSLLTKKVPVKARAPGGPQSQEVTQVLQLTGQQTQRLLQVQTAAQSGQGTIVKELDKAQSKWLASRLKDALLRDIDDAAAAGDDEVVKALKLARERWRLNSQAVTEIGDSTLSRLIGKRTSSPEVLADRFFKLRPSEIASSMKIIESTNPVAAMSVRRTFIERAIAAGREISATQRQGFKFSAAKFLKTAPDIETARALGLTRQEIVSIGQVSRALERIADKAFEGSPTFPLQMAWDVARAVFTLSPTGAAQAGAAILTPRRIAQAMLTPQGRAALLTLTKTKAGTKNAIAAANALMLTIAGEPDIENVLPVTAQDLN